MTLSSSFFFYLQDLLLAIKHNSSIIFLFLQRANIMNIFFEKHLPELVNFISASCPGGPGNTSEGASRGVGSDCVAKPEVLLNICELLCFCLQQDSFRTK